MVAENASVNRNSFRYGGDESSWWKERCLETHMQSNAQVSNGTERESGRSAVKSDVYLESEASSPLYERTLSITVSVRRDI